MTLTEIRERAIAPALALLPAQMTSREAEVMLLAIGLQESRFEYRRQIGGPARGYFQFELGTRSSRGGVWGVYLHRATSDLLRYLCQARNVLFEPAAIYAAIEHDDVLAAVLARLLLWTDPKPLPALGEMAVAWELYMRTWRPGKPHRRTWDVMYGQAMDEVAP